MDLSRFVEECKSAFAVAYPKGFWLVLNLIGTATAFPILLFFGFTVMPEKKDPLYYLLSAQAQTLATVFVLAFTFTLVAAQITSRYSQRLIDRVLGPWALWYAVPYGLGILLPFFLLQGWFYLWSVTVSVLIMVYCIISLIPFALAVRGLLSISGALAEKKKRIMAAKSDADVQVSLSELVNIVVGALNQKDYESFELGPST